MKTAGLFLLFLSVCSAGFLISNDYILILKEARRTEELLKNFLIGIRSENISLSEIFEKISDSCDSKTKEFIKNLNYKDFQKIDSYILKSGFCKNRTIINILSKAFSILGRYSASEQISEIESCIALVQAFYEKNEDEILSKSKLFKSFGILMGLLAVILSI